MLSTIDEPYQIESAEIKHELSNDAISRALARVDALLRSENSRWRCHIFGQYIFQECALQGDNRVFQWTPRLIEA